MQNLFNKIKAMFFGGNVSFYLVPDKERVFSFLSGGENKGKYGLLTFLNRGRCRGRRTLSDEVLLMLVIGGLESIAQQIVEVHKHDDTAKKIAEQVIRSLEELNKNIPTT